jgi:hypothetical protein
MTEQQQTRVSISQIYEAINRAYPLNDPTLDVMREQEYAEVVDIELDKFVKAIQRANEKNLDANAFLATLYATGKLEDLFGILFMAAKPQHRVQISYLYDAMDLLFKRTRNQQAQAK